MFRGKDREALALWVWTGPGLGSSVGFSGRKRVGRVCVFLHYSTVILADAFIK